MRVAAALARVAATRPSVVSRGWRGWRGWRWPSGWGAWRGPRRRRGGGSSLDAVPSSTTTVNLAQYHRALPTDPAPAAPPFWTLNGPQAPPPAPPQAPPQAPQYQLPYQPQPPYQQQLPAHPHSLHANGGYGGASAHLNYSDKSLDSVELMDLYEDATRQEYDEAARANSGLSGGGLSEMAQIQIGDDDGAQSFTLEWETADWAAASPAQPSHLGQAVGVGS